MSSKRKSVRARMEQHRDVLILLVPLIIATIIVVWQLIPPELLGMFGDAYTVALLFTMLLVMIFAAKRRGK